MSAYSVYNTIVRITDTMGGSQWQGSGVLVSPDEVLTASHVVWTTGVGVATGVQVTPGYGTGTSPGTFSGTVTHYNAIDDSLGLLSLATVSMDYALIHLSTPLTVGYMALGADYGAGPATVSGYPGTYSQVDAAESVTTVSPNILQGTTIGEGSSGGPVWTADGSVGGYVQGLVSAGSLLSTTGYFMKITSSIRAQLQSWIAQDDAGLTSTTGNLGSSSGSTSGGTASSTPGTVQYTDTKTGAHGTAAMSAAVGGPSYLQWSYIWAGSDPVSMVASAANSYVDGGSGNDAITVTSGQNVLDGGLGSNFLVGGSGTDTFFTDARGAGEVWNTMENFHAGDSATLWGFKAGVSSYSWDAAPSGAAGYTGATLRANIVGGSGRTGTGIDASITFTGLSVAQAKMLQVSTGTQTAGSYLYLYNPGV